nr:reverse transcriptase domain-containing protein [Devosia subaequoris]
MTTAELYETAASISLAAPENESLRIKAKDKKAWPEFRAIYSFGPRETARQNLVKMALRPQLPSLPYQFLSYGGRNAAVDRVQEKLESGRYRFAATLDIRNFYPSIDRTWLASHLPVGENVSRNTIFLENNQSRAHVSGYGLYRHAIARTTVLDESRKGLLQGAASSPTIAEALTAAILRDLVLPEGVALSNYADNFVVLASDRGQLEAAVHSLQDAFARHPSGELRLISDGIRRVSDGFVFLGYQHKRRKGKVTSVPLEQNKCKFIKRVRRLTVGILLRGADPRSLHRYVLSWVSAFRHWKGRYGFVMQTLRPFSRVSAVRTTFDAVLERARVDFAKMEAEALRENTV